jgi:putative transcriptional regulator
MTQTELAKMAGVSTSAISLLENGNRNPSVKLAGSLCRALNIPIGDLLEEYSIK